MGPKGEIIIEPTANSYVLDEFISCIKQAHKQKGLVYITAKTEATENETYVITDLRNAACELNYNRNSFPSISYKAHCPIVNLGEKSITGTYDGIDVGDYVHLDFLRIMVKRSISLQMKRKLSMTLAVNQVLKLT